MKLYVCYGTWTQADHPCGKAHAALVATGHEPEVVRAYGWKLLPDAVFNRTAGRRRAKELTGSTSVPVLELDDGAAIGGSQQIIEWAGAHPR